MSDVRGKAARVNRTACGKWRGEKLLFGAHDPFNMRPTRKGQFMQLHQALPIRKIFIASLALVFLSGPDA
ncbi:MAG: hypothetical protein VX538_04950, partial [Pseudomonadota bacterium]|nr:hypothetical protein [Pseudomonadota bacterium]